MSIEENKRTILRVLTAYSQEPLAEAQGACRTAKATQVLTSEHREMQQRKWLQERTDATRIGPASSHAEADGMDTMRNVSFVFFRS